MSVKQSVLQALEENREICVSGEQLAKKLSVSRSSIWKAIKSLKEEGYDIAATTNKGYRLETGSDVLSFEGMVPWLAPENKNLVIKAYKTIGSTNQVAKKMAMDGESHGTVVIAEEQTQGRGRMGRDFYSPAGSGIYMSLILRPDVYASEAVLVTTAASVGVYRAIKKVTDKDPQIKWVNDIYLEDRKICGILTEAVTNFETGLVECVIIGIGVNFRLPENNFPGELNDVAGSLFREKPDTLTRNRLAAEIINAVLELCNDLGNRDFLKEYKAHSMVLGHEISVCQHNSWLPARAIDISEDGGLIIENEAGQLQTLNSGEISIRRMDKK
ncbi:biotin--[acetyl-CoA-carboxylase] ligase [Acetobacterium bakii]|uniref:Bifunctional ligase/repressor BirA n=1 Tax=Acetobacterium bakii TaxID=52689 RepID=A0A0L6U1Z8_9FIRM|nr:biotin--[acetyl-CoA-carboxylase] ligase [Acetobacterium bakii]KNZ42543.1 biotin synthase [Acetobacterium bakii]